VVERSPVLEATSHRAHPPTARIQLRLQVSDAGL